MLKAILSSVGAVALVTAPVASSAIGSESEVSAAFTGDIQIVHFNDAHGSIDATDTQIGYPGIGAFIDEARAANPNTLVLDAGDVLAGSPYSAVDNGLGFAPILNTLGIDAMTAGNSEYVFGKDAFTSFVDVVEYPVLSGNMIDESTGEPIAPGHTLVELPNGMTVGVVGVTTPGAFAEGLRYTDAVESMQRSVDRATSEGADIVVGLTHLGELDSDMNVGMITERVTGLDVVIDGHSRTLYPEGILRNGVLVAQAGANTEHIGIVTLSVVAGDVTGVTARVVSKDDLGGTPPKASTQAELEKFLERANAYLSEPIGPTSAYLDGSRSAVRTGETNLGNMFTDAVREHTGADLALIHAGFIGGEIPIGPVTRRDAYAIARVDAAIASVSLTGAQIVDYLELSARELPDPAGSLLHISGGRYSYDLAERPGRIVHSVVVAGEPIDEEATYTVAMLADIAPNVGATEITQAGSTAEIIEAYIRTHSPVAPQVEGRILAAEVPTGGPGGDPESPGAPEPVPSVPPTTEVPSEAPGGDAESPRAPESAPPVPPTAGVDEASSELAESGADPAPGWLAGLALAATGIALVIAARARGGSRSNRERA